MCMPHPAEDRYLSTREVLLIRQLRQRGIRGGRIPGFFWSLKSCLRDAPGASLGQLNCRLEELGWGAAPLDARTLQMARAAVAPLQEVGS